MNVSFTERLMELNNARERSLISEEEYCMLRLKIFDAFTSSSTPSTTSSVTQYTQPQQQPLSSPNDKSQQQHVTFSQQTFNSSPAKPLSGKTKIPSAQSVHSSNGSLSSTQQSPQSPQSPRLLSRQINDNISNNIMNDSSTPENVIGTNSVSPTNQIYIPKRTRSSLASHALQETNINNNEELSVKTTRGLSTLSESQHTTTTSASIKSPSSPPPSMSSSIPILKTIIRDSSASKKNLSMNRSTPMAYINPDPTSLFAHNNSTNNHNVTTNIMNHNELNNGEINNIKNEENHLTNGRITSYDNMNAMGHSVENVNTNNDDNSINSGVMCHTSINNGVMNQSDERTEMIQTSVNRMNFMNNMNGNSGDDDDRLVSSLQPFSQSQSAPLPQQRQNINSVTLSARQIRSRSLGPSSVLSSDNDTNNNNINNNNNNYNNNDNDNNNGSSNSNSFTNRLRNRNSHGNLNTRRSLNFGEVMNSLNRGGDLVETGKHQYEQSVPEVPPPPYSPPESSPELRKELLKLTEESKKEQDSWRIEEARLRMRINSKPEEIERVKRKMKESNEKYRKKIEAVTAKLRQLSFNNVDGN
ncbi:9687_t:CDS:2 [Racocetra fulgida]|uniref:9687_t:CDS:1 n=1 Tax=Racocetra fulgida TaxID=60492 RepID=A0A9N8WKI5_9GLOM|nr:9687_t:CDS:2 [Racocetra fulgida]